MAPLNRRVLERIVHSTRDAVINLKVTTVLNPALWMCGIISVPTLFLAAFGPETLRNPFLLIAGIPVGISALAFLYFMLKDPDRLQSEKYRIESRALDIVQEKGGGLSIAASDLELIPNPVQRRLEVPKTDISSEIVEGRAREGQE